MTVRQIKSVTFYAQYEYLTALARKYLMPSTNLVLSIARIAIQCVARIRLRDQHRWLAWAENQELYDCIINGFYKSIVQYFKQKLSTSTMKL